MLEEIKALLAKNRAAMFGFVDSEEYHEAYLMLLEDLGKLVGEENGTD